MVSVKYVQAALSGDMYNTYIIKKNMAVGGGVGPIRMNISDHYAIRSY